MTKTLLALVNTALVVVYPFAVFFGMSRFGARSLGLLLLALLLPRLLLSARGAARADLWAVLRVPLTIVALVATAAALDQPLLLLALPVVVNLALLGHFAGSLRGPVSLVERLARMQEPELPPGGPAYCRTVTKVWCGFFLMNAAVAGGLAIWGSLAAWTLFTGLISYLLVGALFTAEFVARRWTFRRFGGSLPDRLLARVMRGAPER
ncbi:MAG: hypothetical protein IPK80_29315 [Nannocystis sp.]|nr:hypothetical protein [Nannocystis sp.]